MLRLSVRLVPEAGALRYQGKYGHRKIQIGITPGKPTITNTIDVESQGPRVEEEF